MYDHRQDSEAGGQNAVRCVQLVLRSIAVSAEVFLHRRFGERYLGVSGPAAVLVMWCYALFWPHHDLRPMFVFLAVYLVMCFDARIDTLRRRRSGDVEHSMYSGYPRIMRFLPRLDEIKVKQFVEPLLVFVIGIETLRMNQPLGAYLMLAAFCLFASNTMNEAAERRQALDMHDAVIRQRQIAERFRRMQGHWN